MTHVDLSDRTVLVIGGAGYVGSVLVPVLLEAGAQVRILDQLIYDNGFAIMPLLDHPRVHFHRGDLRGDLAQAAHGVTDVVLLAALVGDPICKSYPELVERCGMAASGQQEYFRILLDATAKPLQASGKATPKMLSWAGLPPESTCGSRPHALRL
jgi:hypothetical protein